MRRTPIYDVAVRGGATMGEVAGWLMARSFGGGPVGETPALLWDESHWRKVLVEGQDGARALGGFGVLPQSNDSLPVGAGIRLRETAVYRLRADQLILLAPPGAADKRTDERLTAHFDTEQGGDLSVTDVTHGQAQLRLAGPAAAGILSQLCGLDFNTTQFPNLSARQTSVAKTAQLIIRDDLPNTILSAGAGAIPSYALIGARSLGAYLWEMLLDAGRAFGIRPLGSEEAASFLAWMGSNPPS